jgi:hypothetical protein
MFFFEVLAVLGRTHARPYETYRDAFLSIVEAGVFRHPMTAALGEHCACFLARGLTGYDACYEGWRRSSLRAGSPLMAARIS